MEIKVSILWKLFKEKLEESINILGSGICIASTATTMRVTNI
jgi:hypothetical protein